MTTPSEKPVGNNTFSSFTVGVAFGVVVALLFGTEEGRKLVKKAVDAIPDKYKRPPVFVDQHHMGTPVIPLEETSHHTFEDPFNEAPPPPAPHVRPSRPEPFKPSNFT